MHLPSDFDITNFGVVTYNKRALAYDLRRGDVRLRKRGVVVGEKRARKNLETGLKVAGAVLTARGGILLARAALTRLRR